MRQALPMAYLKRKLHHFLKGQDGPHISITVGNGLQPTPGLDGLRQSHASLPKGMRYKPELK